MKTMESHLSLWSNMFVLLAGSLLTSAEATITSRAEIAPASLPQKLLYKVDSKTLAGLKDSLVQVNLHMRQNANQIRPQIRLTLSGEGIVWLKKNTMDAELKNMIEWFHDEDIQMGLDQNWVRHLNIHAEDLSPGVSILPVQKTGETVD